MRCARANQWSVAALLVGGAALASLGGCTTPDKANIALRKQNQQLQEQVTTLQRVHAADQAAIAGLRHAGATLPTLPPERLDQLFTVHGFTIGRLTGGADLDPARPGDEGLKLYVTPIDKQGDSLKAAGSFEIEAFDLARQESQKIGAWSFPLQDAGKNWYGTLLNCYVLTCPWQTVPRHDRLTVKITFTDALTGRRFTQQKVVEVRVPMTPATQAGPQ
jgi:hypothetical protein